MSSSSSLSSSQNHEERKPLLLHHNHTQDENRLPSLLSEPEDNNDQHSTESMNHDDKKSTKNKILDTSKPIVGLPWSFMILLFSVSAAQSMSNSLLGLLLAKSLEPQQVTYFWTFMSWVYWWSPISGWVSDVCGNRRVLLVIGLIINMGAWALTTFQAGDSFSMFIVWGVLQNAAMLFVNAAINGALVEVVKALGEKSADDESSSSSSSSSGDDDSDSTLRTRHASVIPPSASASASVAGDDEEQEQEQEQHETATINNDDTNVQQSTNDDQVSIKRNQTMLSKSGDTQSAAMFARSFGSVCGMVIQTFALVQIEIRQALVISIQLYFLTTVIAVFADFTGGRGAKKKKVNNDTFYSRILSLFNRLRLLCDTKTGEGQARRSAAIDVVILLTFIFCNNMLPDAMSFYSTYIFDAFDYPNWFNSTYMLGNLIGALVACEVYRRLLAPLSQTRVFFAGCLFAAFSYITGIAFCTGFTRKDLHIPNAVYLMVDTFIVGFLNRLAFMPILHVASVRCPKGFEAVVFELFSLAAIGGSTVASLVAIQIANALGISKTNWDNLWILMVIAACSRVLPTVVVPYLPPPREIQKSHHKKNKKRTTQAATVQEEQQQQA